MKIRPNYCLPLGTVAGIRVQLHWTLVAAFVGLFVWLLWESQSLLLAGRGLVVILLLFACVILHELGHALTARFFRVNTLDVTLYPVGGMARLERMPRVPRQELLIAAAGPAVNLAIALALLLVVVFSGSSLALTSFLQDPILALVFWMNLGLFVFNLLPAFPMDGGRVLRAALALRTSYRTATRVAVWTGQTLAVVFAALAILSVPGFRGFNPLLLFIAFFVFVAASQEGRNVLRGPIDVEGGAA
ncbi:MAG: site-2 protease family protein [Bacteroidota bacterium]|nr:site-2 protease family protein [Bacteroidota bacterium]MDE2956900.1 site-2 protease family protein [Bacteroidota bacterium]